MCSNVLKTCQSMITVPKNTNAVLVCPVMSIHPSILSSSCPKVFSHQIGCTAEFLQDPVAQLDVPRIPPQSIASIGSLEFYPRGTLRASELLPGP